MGARAGRMGVLAERVGFEPTVRGYRTLAFQASAFDRSATSPPKARSVAQSLAQCPRERKAVRTVRAHGLRNVRPAVTQRRPSASPRKLRRTLPRVDGC